MLFHANEKQRSRAGIIEHLTEMKFFPWFSLVSAHLLVFLKTSSTKSSNSNCEKGSHIALLTSRFRLFRRFSSRKYYSLHSSPIYSLSHLRSCNVSVTIPSSRSSNCRTSPLRESSSCMRRFFCDSTQFCLQKMYCVKVLFFFVECQTFISLINSY